MGTVVALFDNYTDAQRAVDMLASRGIGRDSVSFAAQESSVTVANGANGTNIEGTHHHAEVAEGVSTGALVGGGAGLLVGIAALMIPGVGPLFVTGVLASVITSTLAGATAGAATGGLSAALAEHGLPEDTADLYAEGVGRGGVVLSVNTDNVQQARELLQAANATNVHNVVN
jgi:hypothetical protein